MVYLKDWNEFQRLSEELYQKSPEHTRFLTSYRHCDGILILKVTDDRTCLKLKTDQMADLNKLDRLSRSLLEKFQNRQATPMDIDDSKDITRDTIQTMAQQPSAKSTQTQRSSRSKGKKKN
ncbi:uncharacterized protein VTP21DRAFT_3626 [Calcarisporiella thermophila]|uniref:uncharacterized protein n=1 Tax=Calcarisporiella thermophila TaxID=911321 RepID=UPI0037443685